ncbi:hypothetical protein CsSME_00018836 [Camellia sinensis var. sinensis]
MGLTPLLQQWWQELYKTTLIKPFVFPLLLSSLLLFLLKFKKSVSKFKFPPSPPRLPVIGHLHLLGNLPHRSLHALSEKYGPMLLLYLGGAPTLVVNSAKIAKEIMKTHDIAFANRVQTRAADALMYGCTSLGFAPYGEYWRQMRRICVLELLSIKRVQSFHFVREEEVATMIENIRNSTSLDGGANSVNLGDMLVDTMTSIISRCILGKKYEGEDNKKRFGQLARNGMELLIEFSFQDFFPSFGWIDALTGLVKKLKDTSQGLDAFLDDVIEIYRTSKGNDDQPGNKCLIEILLHLQEEGKQEIDISQDNLKGILLDMFIGGTDTTSTAIEWAMTELIKNPTKLKKAQEEVRRVVGEKSKVNEDDIDQMVYLNWVVKEALRLHAPIPFLFRQETIGNESTKLGGYDIPPRTRVFINAWAIHRDPKLWDNPEDFVPERFANNLIDFKGQDFNFIPFGGGRRGCPGFSFGVLIVEYVLANLLYWFDWKYPSGPGREEDFDMSEVTSLVVHKKIPLQLVPALHSPSFIT